MKTIWGEDVGDSTEPEEAEKVTQLIADDSGSDAKETTPEPKISSSLLVADDDGRISDAEEDRLLKEVPLAPFEREKLCDGLRRLAFTIYLPSLLLQIGQTLTLPVAPLYILQELDKPLTSVGVAISTSGLGNLISLPMIGVLSEKLGSKNCLLISVLVRGISSFVIWTMQDFRVLLVCMFFVGASTAGWDLGRQSFMTVNSHANTRGSLVSFIGGCARGGSVVGPFIGGMLAFQFGNPTVYWVRAVICLLVLILVWFAMDRDSPKDLRKAAGDKDAETAIPEPVKGSYKDVMVNHWRVILLYGTYVFILGLSRVGRKHILTLAGHMAGIEKDKLGILNSVSWLLDALMFPTSGILMDRYGRKYSCALGILTISLGYLSMSMIPMTFGSLLIPAVVFGCGNAMTAGLVMTTGADFGQNVPMNNRSRFLAIYRAPNNSTKMIASIVLTWLLDSFSVAVSCLTFFAIGMVGLLWVVLILPESKNYYANPKKYDPVESSDVEMAQVAGAPKRTKKAAGMYRKAN